MNKELLVAIEELVGNPIEVIGNTSLQTIDNSAQYIIIEDTEYSVERMTDDETFKITKMPESDFIGFVKMTF